MTTAVHIFSYRGLVNAPVTISQRSSEEGAFLLREPYLAGEVLAATVTAVSSSSATAPAHTEMLRIQVEDGATIRYEVNGGSRAVAASASSPRLSGETYIPFQIGATISVIQA